VKPLGQGVTLVDLDLPGIRFVAGTLVEARFWVEFTGLGAARSLRQSC